MKGSRIRPQIALTPLVCSLALVTSCASRNVDGEQPDAATSSLRIERTVETLQQSTREFEIAREARDPEAMVRATLKRLKVSQLVLSDAAKTQLNEKTLEMVQQARIVAANDAEAQLRIDQLLSEADFDPATKPAGDGFLGRLLGGLGSEYIETYVLEPGNPLRLRMNVSPDDGALVFVEAPANAGVVLRTSDPSQSDNCVDDSNHGSLGCRWRPRSGGDAQIVVESPVPYEVSILMITSAPVILDE